MSASSVGADVDASALLDQRLRESMQARDSLLQKKLTVEDANLRTSVTSVSVSAAASPSLSAISPEPDPDASPDAREGDLRSALLTSLPLQGHLSEDERKFKENKNLVPRASHDDDDDKQQQVGSAPTTPTRTTPPASTSGEQQPRTPASTPRGKSNPLAFLENVVRKCSPGGDAYFDQYGERPLTPEEAEVFELQMSGGFIPGQVDGVIAGEEKEKVAFKFYHVKSKFSDDPPEEGDDA
ncbi:hypothetical protein PPROV_000474000 [Pycnococcus provasolii]|uniref:Uncharacterized protein n=1 Tax=Pycnococcus provasolii TaxID=41880 RepID=A0A830HHG7_9CHLO|nr:hypothetical protein PPROV_000474000 [Pycnococcus provasolii]